MGLVKENCKRNVITLIVGNKLDLSDDREVTSFIQVSKKEAENWALKKGYPYFESSAVSESNIEDIFNYLIKCTNLNQKLII